MAALLAGPGFIALAALLGLLVGSFLNVVIHRLPRMLERQWRAEAALHLPQAAAVPEGDAAPYNLVVPRSACPHCQAPISALQNIPVVSWLVLRGRCAACRAPISSRYPLVEACTALLSGLVAWRFGFGFPAACALAVTWSLVALAGIDFDTQLLPDAITLPLLWAGLLASLATPTTAGAGAAAASLPVAPGEAIIGAACGYLSLWLVFQVFRLATGKEGMGHGDFKLLAALGAWLGWRMLLPIVLCSALVGAAVGIGLMVARRRGREVPIPFGPFLAAAGWLAMMWGHEAVDAYLHLYARP